MLDTGACVTIITKDLWTELAFGNSQLAFLGVCKANVTWNGESNAVDMHVFDKCDDNLLGRDLIRTFKMNVGELYDNPQRICAVKSSDLEKILAKYDDVFKPDIGKCVKAQATLKFKGEPKPKFLKARSVPYAVKAKVEADLQGKIDEGILKPVEYSEWATPLVVVPKKDGKVRICAGFKVTVNPQLEIDQYPLPRPEELFQASNGGKQFSKLDLKEAYLQLPLDEQSKKYMTINTHKRLLQYQSIPFGVASAPAIFQRVMETMLQGLEGVIVYLDDITITAPNAEEHLQRLEEVLKRLQDYGFRVKKEKCEFLRDRVEFLGHTVCNKRISTSPTKVEAMLKMPAPKDLKEVESFLGMVQYYAKFIPQLASMAVPLNALRKKEAKFVWKKEQEDAFQQIRAKLADTKTLTHYDPKELGASFVATLSPLPVYLANGSSSPPSSVNIPGPAPKRQRHQDRHHQEHSSNHHSSSTPRCSNSAAETAGSSGSAAPAQRRQTGQRPRGQPRADRPTRPARLERWISGEMRRLFEEMREMRTTVEALASRTPSEAGTSSAPKPANPTVADDAEKPTLHNSEKAL
ncbi:hypothetical protein QR680_008545 [Steinernema hermaphroditum]|uniref:RNA-directed DNA polymerase n=1 Tax=Steinernema hermaphroditum TaxID=289476 RepID=A0AA39M7V1_9BILA|nr:hypothetical protein QR680_008545 [Steinernema hermaphroditum]